MYFILCIRISPSGHSTVVFSGVQRSCQFNTIWCENHDIPRRKPSDIGFLKILNIGISTVYPRTGSIYPSDSRIPRLTQSWFISTGLDNQDRPINGQKSHLMEELQETQKDLKKYERKLNASSWQRNLFYPLLWMLLLALAVLFLFFVGLNVFRLLFGIKALPVSIKVRNMTAVFRTFP